ncbi:MAG: hypothetical protein WA919_02350 [Coleofasciculaceae cyanobacterium]
MTQTTQIGTPSDHEDVYSAITSGRNLGLTLAQIKERFADSIQVNQGHDKELATNLANGLIDGAVFMGVFMKMTPVHARKIAEPLTYNG